MTSPSPISTIVAGGHIGIDTHEAGARVACFDARLGEEAPNIEGMRGDLALDDRLEHLLLARMVAGDTERHKLLEVEFVCGVGFKQLRARRSELQALAHDGGRDAERGGDIILALVLLAECCEGAELVERVQRLAVGILGEAVILKDAGGLDDAGDGRVLGEALPLCEKLEGAQAAPAGLDLIAAGLVALRVKEWTHAQGLEQAAARDAFGQSLDGIGGVDPADIAVAEHELVEGNAGGWDESEFFLSGHEKVSVGRMNGSRREPLSRLRPSPILPPPSSSAGWGYRRNRITSSCAARWQASISR
jgi:hypothetical protein